MSMNKFPRGAWPTSKERVAAAQPHTITRITPVPLQFIRLPKELSFWGNDIFGCCVTAEEAFAKACHSPEVYIGYHKAVKWARRNWALNGAGLWEIMTLMQTDGFYDGAFQYNDGPFKSVDWADADILHDAIYQGPVKIGVAADQFQSAAPTIGESNGWVLTGLTPGQQDHCTSLCGYGTFAYLAKELGATLPAGSKRDTLGYAMFTWSTIGLIDRPSLMAICGEAWLRDPSTIVKPNPVSVAVPAKNKWWKNLVGKR
jgi:hypothetical protein